MKSYIFNIVYALDILINAIFKGKKGETISCRLGSEQGDSFLEISIDWIFYKMGWWNDNDHCEDVAKSESKRY